MEIIIATGYHKIHLYSIVCHWKSLSTYS